MKTLRRIALVLSLGLLVAVTVAYFARHSEAGSSRDMRLASAAVLAANDVESLLESVQVAVQAGTEPSATAQSISKLKPHLSVCVANAVRVECAGDRPDAVAADAEKHLAEFRDELDSKPTRSSLSVFDRIVTIDAVGTQLAAVVSISSADLFAGSDSQLWVASRGPAFGVDDQFVTVEGVRQTLASIEGSGGLVVVASAADTASVSSGELNFYLLLGVLAVVLMLLAGATSRLEHRNLLERASIDQLTRLPNRGEFERLSSAEIAAAERSGDGFALLLFDLNGFKLVNDNYGHQAGDELLQIVAERLQRASRDTDIVARWGGDEFVVLMPGVASAEMGGRRARQIADAMSGRTRLDSTTEAVRVKASVGVAIWPTNGATLHELMGAADTAMYHAKRHQLTAAIAGDTPGAGPVGTLPQTEPDRPNGTNRHRTAGSIEA